MQMEGYQDGPSIVIINILNPYIATINIQFQLSIYYVYPYTFRLITLANTILAHERFIVFLT